MIWPIGAIGWVTGMIQRGAASMGRLGVILDSTPSIADSPQTNHQITQLQGEITFDHVTLQYPSGTSPALRDVSFHVPVGGSLGILGPVGSGKSSIMNLIPRLFDATSGTVSLDGHDVRTIPLDVLRSSVAVVPQESFLFSETIAENIRFGRPTASEDAVHTAAERAQIVGDIQRLPHGYDTVVGERGVTLSGGQKQRTALARALACEPAILILDDALSAVDTHTEARIVEGLTAVMQHRTTIIIAHRISTLQHCDTIIVLQDGIVTEQGHHDALLELGGHYAETYQRQLLEEQLS
jgi:ATP-binding cassette subfamily B protein